MWPYWMLLAVPAFFAVSRLKLKTHLGQSEKLELSINGWVFIYLFLVLVIGLRHEVGGDWFQYIEMIESYIDNINEEKFKFQDPAFVLINKIAVWSGSGVYGLNLISAIIFSWGLLVFCKAQPRPWLALTVAVPYLITVVAMGYTRQCVSIGIAMVAMVALGQGSILRFFLWVAFAALFHKSAIILLPIAILSSTKRRFFTIVWGAAAIGILFILLLEESTSFLIQGYIESGYQSSGAAIRISMNAVPGVLFLLFRKRFQLSTVLRTFWMWMAWSSLLFILLLIVSPSSTAVDRLALYWIPLQLFVFSRLPNALGKNDGKNASWVYAVVLYSIAVHYVWLVYADSSFAWLPYQFYPWVWLWQ